MKKSYMICALVLSLILGLTGCSGLEAKKTTEDKKEVSKYDEHLDISLSYWLIDDAFSDRENDEVLKRIEDKFNVTFIPVNVTWDDYYNKILQWSESGQLPDVFAGAYRFENNYLDFVKSGLLHDIPSDLSKYPNLSRYMDSPELESCKVGDKAYCIFRQTYSEQAETTKDRTIIYRWDLAKKAGINKEPENWDEFREMIQAIIEKDPEGKHIQGMTAKGYTMLEGLLVDYSVPLASSGGSSFYWVESNNRFVPALFAGEKLGEDALPTWHLIRDMYDEGTIENDILLVTTSQAEEKFLNGKSAAICIDGGLSNTKLYENIGRFWKETNGDEFWDDVKYLELMPDVNGELYYPVWDYAWSETYINANVSDEKLDRILAIYDYLLSEEGTLLSNFGIENETYRIAEDKSIELIEGVTPSEKYPSIKTLSYLVCWNYGNLSTYRYPNIVPNDYALKDEERVAKARKIKIPEYSDECSLKFFEMGTDFNIDLNNIFSRMLVGPEPVDELWESIVDEYKEKGLERIIDKVNTEVSK